MGRDKFQILIVFVLILLENVSHNLQVMSAESRR